MKISKFLSGYLKAASIKKPRAVTIAGVRQETFTPKDKKPETKLIVKFKEFEQEVILSKAGIRQIAVMVQPDVMLADGTLDEDKVDTDLWIGQTVVIFNDLTVSNPQGGFGGIRFRAQV